MEKPMAIRIHLVSKPLSFLAIIVSGVFNTIINVVKKNAIKASLPSKLFIKPMIASSMISKFKVIKHEYYKKPRFRKLILLAK